MKTKQKGSTSAGAPGLGESVRCAQSSTVWEIPSCSSVSPHNHSARPARWGMPISQMEKLRLRERLTFLRSPGRFPPVSTRPEGLRAGRGPTVPPWGDPDSHLRYSSEPSPSGSYCHPRLRRRDGWEPRLCTSVPHQHSCSGPGSSPGNPISQPGQATLTPSPSHWDLNNGTCGGAALRSRLARPFTSPSFGVP